MTEPDGDHRAIDTSLEQLHCRSVSQDVRRHTLGCERWAFALCNCDLSGNQMLEGVGAQPASGAVRKEEALLCAVLFAGPCFEHCNCRFGERRAAFLPAFPLAADMGAGAERNIFSSQTGYLGQTESSLDGNQQDRVVSPAQSRALVHAHEQRFHLVSGEVADQGPCEPFIRDCEDALDQCSVLRHLQRGVMIKRPDGRQSRISTARTVGSASFQVVQKRRQERSVELGQRQLRRWCFKPSLSKLGQQPEGLGISRDGVWTRFALGDQPLCKERLA